MTEGPTQEIILIKLSYFKGFSYGVKVTSLPLANWVQV